MPGGVTLPATILLDAKLTRIHPRIDTQQCKIFAKTSSLRQGNGRKMAKLIKRPARSAATTATTIPGAATTLSILKIAAVVDMNPRNCHGVSPRKGI